MACIGTFEWAVNEVDRIQKRFDRWCDKAESHGNTVRSEVGYENLVALSDSLDEPLRILSCITDDINKQHYDEALQLSKRISDSM